MLRLAEEIAAIEGIALDEAQARISACLPSDFRELETARKRHAATPRRSRYGTGTIVMRHHPLLRRWSLVPLRDGAAAPGAQRKRGPETQEPLFPPWLPAHPVARTGRMVVSGCLPWSPAHPEPVLFRAACGLTDGRNIYRLRGPTARSARRHSRTAAYSSGPDPRPCVFRFRYARSYA